MFFLLALLACPSENLLPADSAAPSEPGPTCDWTRTPVDGADDPGLGITVAAHLDALDDLVETTLKWDQTGETTDLVTQLAPAGAEWVTGELVDPETGAPVDPADLDTGIDPATACPPYLAVTGTLSLATADGHLAEAVEVEARSEAAGVARVDAEVRYEDLAGEGIPLGTDPAEWDSVVIDIAVNLSAGRSQGELAVYAERVSDTEDVGYSDDIARWPWE